MARWLVTQGDHQFSAADLKELKSLAQNGQLGAGDMVQPPGASDWLYASELPELAPLFSDEGTLDDDDDSDWDMPKTRNKTPIAVLLMGIVLFGGWGMWNYGQKLPNHEDLQILGGTTGLQLTEMIASTDTKVYAQPLSTAQAVGTISKNSTVQLLGKRGDWYEVRNATGAQGYVATNTVVPAYYFAKAETRQSHDPIYNPDRYVFVKNSSWMQLPDQRAENVTIFQFLLQNKSKFNMTAIKLMATIKDKNDRVIETQEIVIEGPIPAHDGVMVGTLKPAANDPTGSIRLMTTGLFAEALKADPSLMSRWSDGVELTMESEGFVEANIDLLQVRAIPEAL
jgi:hypothetical protein